MDQPRPRQFYSGPLGALVLEEPNANQSASMYLQWARLRHYQYPDVDVTAMGNIRTLYPATVELEFIVLDADRKPMRNAVLADWGLKGRRPVPVTETWGHFITSVWHHNDAITPWTYLFSINGIPWHLVDQTLEAVLQMTYPQNTVEPETMVSVQVHLEKRSDTAIRLLSHIPCQWNPEATHWDPMRIIDQVNQSSLSNFEKRDVPGQIEQWMSNPTHPIDDGLILFEYQWGFTYIKTFWRWYRHAGTLNTHIHVKLLIHAIMHYGPQNVPAGTWEILLLSKFPIMHLVLQTCPCAYMHLPIRHQHNLNLVRHLLLHHGHMFPMIPKILQSNTGLLLLATQSSPTLYEAYLHELISTRQLVNTHQVVQIVTAEGSGKWWPWVLQEKEVLLNSTRVRPY